MKIITVLTILIFLNCMGLLDAGSLHGIEWCELAGKTYSSIEPQNYYQTVKISMRFGYGDTIYMTKKYWNPRDSSFPVWFRYFRCPVYGKHWEIPPPIEEYNDTNLVFIYSCKEYADSKYQQPVMDNSALVDWFVWKEINDTLYMGYVEETSRKTFYYKWFKEQ